MANRGRDEHLHDQYKRSAHDAQAVDRMLNAFIGRFTVGISPVALQMAVMDWMLHLSSHPGRQQELIEKAARKVYRYNRYAQRVLSGQEPEPCIQPLEGDTRFSAPSWQRFPFNLMYQGFLLQQQWWDNAVRVRGVNPHHEDVMHFLTRQVLDLCSPSNFLPTNPEVLERTFQESGMNLVRGVQNLQEDVERQISGDPPVGADEYRVGENMALTPGKVVYRNELMELIQYEPTTKTVHPEPVLICPAWIMKYYILDLSPGKSMVEDLVAQGFTVFMISWKNPGREDRDTGMEDYRRRGVMAALDVVNAICPDRKVHATGYCLGGTLLTLAVAAMAREGDDRLASITLFAAQTDFQEPGELDLFIDESQVTFLEDVMWERGYLDGVRMAGAFQLLRSRDLIYSQRVREYLMGERQGMIELMAWNADTTRLPYRMHSEYLRSLFLRNDLVEGRYEVDGQPIHLRDLTVPIFAVGTVKDHVAPWKSVYKINRLASRAEVTFLLTTGGHNAGIVTPPGHPRRTYQVATRSEGGGWVPPETFHAEQEHHTGSWWPEWQAWLRKRSGRKVQPPEMGGGNVLDPAPGQYVLQR